jgi:outer membrane beta-barrel protein
MEGRIRSLLLGSLIAGLLVPLGSLAAESTTKVPTEPAEEEPKPVIQPAIERREFNEARIDTEDFEVAGFVGLLSVEDFGTNTVYGARLAYHVTEELFIEATVGQSEAGQTSFEVLTGGAPLLTSDERKIFYYNAAIGFNILPGEAFLTRKVTYNNDLYIIAGIGSTDFAGADRLTLSYGLGYRLYMQDFWTIRVDLRDHMFNMDLIGPDRLTHNLEFSAGLSFYF